MQINCLKYQDFLMYVKLITYHLHGQNKLGRAERVIPMTTIFLKVQNKLLYSQTHWQMESLNPLHMR